jgi:hypothetical protein
MASRLHQFVVHLANPAANQDPLAHPDQADHLASLETLDNPDQHPKADSEFSIDHGLILDL